MVEKNVPAQRRIPIWVIVIGAITLIVLAIVAHYFLRPLEGPIPAHAGEAYVALEQSITDEGFHRLGSAGAPVIIEEFSSYACPHCREFHDDRFPALLDAIAAGEVQFIMIPVPQIGPGADDAARAALCAGEQDQFWAMHDVLFYWQDEFLTRTFDPKRLKAGAENLGLDTGAFDACLDDSRTQAHIDAARALFRARELTGTPSFFINGQKVQDYREFDTLIAQFNARDSDTNQGD